MQTANYTADDLRPADTLRDGEVRHNFSSARVSAVMADNPYQPKAHRQILKAQATQLGARCRGIACVGAAQGEEGHGIIKCADGSWRTPETRPLRGLERIATSAVSMPVIDVVETKPLPKKMSEEKRERATAEMMDAIISGRETGFGHKFIGWGKAAKRYGVKVPQTSVHRYKPGT